MAKRKIGKPGGARSPLVAEIPLACQDELAAVEFLERQRWGNEPACPHCGVVEPAPHQVRAKGGARHRRFLWRCNGCGKQFTVRVGTVLEDSRIPFRCWVHAFWSIASNKKGVSALQISRETGLSYKSALFMMHRIRHGMTDDGPAEKMTGTVEIDTTGVGGKPRGPFRPEEPEAGRRRRSSTKTSVLAIVERDGRAHATPLPPADKAHIYAAVRAKVSMAKSRLMTDEAPIFREIGREFSGGHESVCHSAGEYARGEAHSNTAESFFALVKRGHYGIFHKYSRKHMPKYLAEHCFRWDTRKLDDGARTVRAIKACDGKRLTYAEHVGRDASA